MNTGFTDINDTPVSIGDILKYDEGPGYSRLIYEVIDLRGQPHGAIRIDGEDRTAVHDDNPIHLEFFCYHYGTKTRMEHGEVIGNIKDNPEMLAVEYAAELWPEQE